jgi:hypothetical protein
LPKLPISTLLASAARYVPSGCRSKNNFLLLGEALSNEFEGMVLNPFGVEIDLPFWVFKRLKKLRLLSMAIQAIGFPGHANTVHPANYFASSV